MNVIIGVILGSTVLQLFVCKFSLWWIISVIARVLFSLRIIGATFQVKKLCIVEGVAVACAVLFNMIFKSDNVPWIRLLILAAFSLLNAFLMFLDDILYVYVIEDDEE